MKRVSMFLICLSFLFSLCACTNSGKAESTPSATVSTTQETTEATESTPNENAATQTQPSASDPTAATTPSSTPPAQQTPSSPQPTQGSSSTTGTTPDSNIVAEGTCVGTQGKWKLTKDGTLTFYGNARPEDSSTSHVWSKYADQVKKAVFEEGITHVPSRALAHFENLTEVVMSDSIKTIGKDAFSNCYSLSKITIPPKVTELLEGTFAGCSSLTSISYAPGSQLTTLNAGVFGGSALKEFVAPPSLTTIKSRAFAYNDILETVILDGSLEVIENYAFLGCSNLKKVVLGSGLTHVASNAFSECTTIMHYESYAPMNIDLTSLPHLTTVIISGDVDKIPRFTHCSKLSSVTITSPITSILSNQFMGCSALTSLSIPDTVKVIEDYAFVNSGIRELTIPASVKEMGLTLFNKTSLQKIIFTGDPPIFKSNTTDSTFTGLDKLTAYYPADNPAWTQEILQNYGAGEVTWIAQ